MTPEEMKSRTKQYGLRIIQLCESLPNRPAARVIRDQLLRAGTSVGANYRAVCRAKSTADFVSKMGTVEEEADESSYWMELLVEAGIVNAGSLESLIKETDEILSIVVTSINTARKSK